MTMADAPETLPPWSLLVTASPMAVWTRALRDDNPIHVDPVAAEALGFGLLRTVNPGPANLAYVLNMLIAAHPHATLVELDARFLGNVMSGDVVHATGLLDGGRCNAVLAGDDGALLVTATIGLG